MRARVFRRPKAATQSGVAQAGEWIFEYQPEERDRNDPMMGWWGSSDMRGQVRLKFDAMQDAVAYAEVNGVPFDLEAAPEAKTLKPKQYADNFRYGRADNWTH